MNITIIIIIATVLVSFSAFSRRELLYRFEFNPYLVAHSKQYYRIVTHALIHADWMHLLVNMFVLFNFGRVVERLFLGLFGIKGAFFFVLLYIGGVLFAALPGYKKHQNNPGYNAVGASGAVSAVLFSSIIMMPMSKISIFPIPIGIPAFIFGIIYLAYEYYSAKNSNDHIAHDAHYWGALFGVGFTIILEPKLLLNFFNQLF